MFYFGTISPPYVSVQNMSVIESDTRWKTFLTGYFLTMKTVKSAKQINVPSGTRKLGISWYMRLYSRGPNKQCTISPHRSARIRECNQEPQFIPSAVNTVAVGRNKQRNPRPFLMASIAEILPNAGLTKVRSTIEPKPCFLKVYITFVAPLQSISLLPHSKVQALKSLAIIFWLRPLRSRTRLSSISSS